MPENEWSEYWRGLFYPVLIDDPKDLNVAQLITAASLAMFQCGAESDTVRHETLIAVLLDELTRREVAV